MKFRSKIDKCEFCKDFMLYIIAKNPKIEIHSSISQSCSPGQCLRKQTCHGNASEIEKKGYNMLYYYYYLVIGHEYAYSAYFIVYLLPMFCNITFKMTHSI